MRRKIEEKLAAWGESQKRKPLVLNGARQVGKTYSVLKFGKERFAQTVHIDFSAQGAYGALFNDDITPDALIPQIEVLTRMRINPETTLLFFDEVQACPRALTSLKYFCERAPQYHIIAAGSLLGVSLARGDYSYPVGKVDALVLHPLDFEEYLWARGETQLSELIRGSFGSNAAFGLHERAMELYREYLLVGGMPEVVGAFSDQGDLGEARRLQGLLIDGYLADMTKYASPIDSAKILAVWHSIPEQLAKENHKFQYATIASSARAYQYEAAINWLKSAGMISFCCRVSEGRKPLYAFEERDFFKLYLLDVGILACTLGLEPADLLPAANKVSRVRGGIAENYTMQQLVANGFEPCYWGTTSKSEVDFVVQWDGEVVPIEVKSGGNVAARSLESYRKAYCPPYVVRLSSKNFGFERGVRSVPLYAAFCIGG